MKEIREKGNKGVLVLDAGDLLFKKYMNPIPENELKAATEKAHLMVESFNLMGYDALGIGDDDLSLGKEFLLEVSRKAGFLFLSSNIVDEESGKLLFQPYLIKESGGLRIGIFSILSPDVFSGPSDYRKRGLSVRPPVETAQQMVKELQPNTDLIVVLSHLGYQKDLELAHAVHGIHVIVGGHTGMKLVYPPPNRNTIVLQSPPRGMESARLDLILHNHEPVFYNVATKRNLENTLLRLNRQLTSVEAAAPQKAQWQKSKEGIERRMKELQGKNEFTNSILPLHEGIKGYPAIGKMIESYKAKYPEAGKPSSPKQ